MCRNNSKNTINSNQSPINNSRIIGHPLEQNKVKIIKEHLEKSIEKATKNILKYIPYIPVIDINKRLSSSIKRYLVYFKTNLFKFTDVIETVNFQIDLMDQQYSIAIEKTIRSYNETLNQFIIQYTYVFAPTDNFHLSAITIAI